MIWKITLLLMCFSASIIAPRTGQYFPGEECLEELHDLNIVLLLKNIMPTLLDIVIDHDDIQLLTTQCNVNKDCLNNKKVSLKKYRQKIQEIQCINGLYVSKVLDELKTTMVDMQNNTTSISLLRDNVKEYQFYLSRMLALLKLAQWDVYAWQIEMFTFLSGLVDPDANIKLYVEHYENHNVSMRAKVSAFVNQCDQNNYILSQNNTSLEVSAVFQFVETMYKDNGVLKIPSLNYTVPNLMLQNLYLHDDFIFDWSMFEIELDTSNVKREMRTHLGSYNPQDMIDKWRLDPFGSKTYHTLIAKYIHLKAEYAAWFHVHTFHTLQSRLLDATEQNTYFKVELIDSWKSLSIELKRVLRAVGVDENIYWSAINIMMVEFKTISKEELAARETVTRNYFCQSVEDLGLASVSDMNRQLQKLETPNDYSDIFYSVLENVERTTRFCEAIESSSMPFKHSFIRTLLGAEGNETFIML